LEKRIVLTHSHCGLGHRFCPRGTLTDIASFVSDLIARITALAWGLFFLTWTIGWMLRGAPIPILRVKRYGQNLIEDAIAAAFWLAVGTAVFSLIAYIARLIGGSPSISLPVVGQ